MQHKRMSSVAVAAPVVLTKDRLYDKEAESIRYMFNHIAHDYDKLNKLMSLGMDIHWRRSCLRKVAATHPKSILDLATGTGDLAISLKTQNPEAHVTGLDLTEGMLKIAKEKAKHKGLEEQITFTRGDALNMPFEDNSFDAITIAFGVRNFHNLRDGLQEMLRVLSPGGEVFILELSEPSSHLMKPFYTLYSQLFIPGLGKVVAGDKQAYQYLPDSIHTAPQRGAMCDIMREVGFTSVSYKSFFPGVCVFYRGKK